MLGNLKEKLLSSKPQKLARAFVRLGWIGFWLQVVFGMLPVVSTVYLLFFSSTAPTQWSGLGIAECLGLGGLLIIGFTIYWFYRYTRLGNRMLDPEKRPSRTSVINTLWTGLVASCLGILFSMLLLMAEVIRLMIVFMRAPQGGVPVIQTEVQDSSSWVSAMDMNGLLADLCVLAAEFVVMTFTLWLLFRITAATEYEHDDAST